MPLNNEQSLRSAASCIQALIRYLDITVSLDSKAFYIFFIACDSWSTYRDHVRLGVGGGVFVRVVTLWVSDQYFLKGCIDFIQSLQKS